MSIVHKIVIEILQIVYKNVYENYQLFELFTYMFKKFYPVKWNTEVFRKFYSCLNCIRNI